MFSLKRLTWVGALPLLAASLTVRGAEPRSGADRQPTALEPVTVFGRYLSIHDVPNEFDLVGPANQPEWTTRRAFAETDIYVIPSGEIELNQFYVLSHPRDGKAEHLFESEIEIGLPWRTQIDVEPNYRIEDGNFVYDSTRIEVPHALAEWGKIPLNPALDVGWRFNHEGEDSYLVRLLIAEQIGERFHFGANFGFEQQIGGERETEYEWNAALSYVAINKKLTLGVEFLAEYETDDEGESETTVLLGPTALFKPTRDTHLGVVTFAGLTDESPMIEVFFIFGIDLEPFTWGWLRGGSEAQDMQPVRRRR